VNTRPGWLTEGIFLRSIDDSLNSIIVLDLAGDVLFMNRVTRELTVRDFSEIEGKPWISLLPPKLRDEGEAALVLARGGSARWLEYEMETRDGPRLWDSLVSPVHSQTGEIVGLKAIARDISAMAEGRRRAEAQAREALRTVAALRSANRIAQLGGWRYDCAADRVVFSQELLDVVSGEADQPLSEAIQTWVEEDRAPFLAALRHAATFGENLSFDARLIAPDGSLRWFRVLGEPQFVDGHCVTLSGASQDITEQKAALERSQAAEQTARQSADAMSDFLANMSHEIRTPLNGILGMTQAMAIGDLDARQRQHLRVIQTSGEALLALLNDLLDFSKIEAGKIELEAGAFDTRTLAEGVEVFRSLLQDKDVTLHVRVDGPAEGWWGGDVKRIQQILSNLVSNAVKFTERGSIRVGLGCAADGLAITVSDTGVGIAADRLGRIFEKFVQGDASTTRRYGGSGLGLAICRQLAELMGGRIEVESVEGQGSTFKVTLPLQRADAVRQGRSTPEPVPAAHADGLRILAAEDNLMNQLVLRTLLEGVGIEPTIVSNGREAIEAWRTGSWDIVLMDVQMPVMDGVSAVRAMREIETRERLARTPVIALTANAMSHHRAEYVAAGMDGMVAKPIELAMLLHAFDAALAPAATPAAA